MEDIRIIHGVFCFGGGKVKEMELYIHVPFCIKKCAYCDFLSAPAGEEERQRYVETMIKEIQGYRKKYQEYCVTTIFVGGGTPSVLSGEQIKEVFNALRASFVIDTQAEITIEVNPGTVTEEKVEAWMQAGVNRISIGLQSVNDEELQMLGRMHTYKDFLNTYHLLRDKGFNNLNIDLISAIPGQTLESWKTTLSTVAELEPEHISAYSLIVEEGTPFYTIYGAGGADGNLESMVQPLPDEETERFIYEETEMILQKYGYDRYEISNYAKPGYACRHNEGYWRRVNYLGVGLGASSLIENQRFRNFSTYDAYMDAIQNQKLFHEEVESLSVTDEMEEFMFLGLRMMSGISREEFQKKFGKKIETVYEKQIQQLKKDGLIEFVENRIRLTKRGIDISNYVFEQFLL